MWLEALDLVLKRLQDAGLDFSRVKGVSGAGMQHGTIFWSGKADELLAGLSSDKDLVEQLVPEGVDDLDGAFAHTYSPNWQDASTQEQCEAFDACLGGPEKLAGATGSKAHHVRVLYGSSGLMFECLANMTLQRDSAVHRSYAIAPNILNTIVERAAYLLYRPSSLPCFWAKSHQ